MDFLLVYIADGFYSSDLFESQMDLFQLAGDLRDKTVDFNSSYGLKFVNNGSNNLRQLTSFDSEDLSYKLVGGKNVLERGRKFDGGSFDLDSQFVKV